MNGWMDGRMDGCAFEETDLFILTVGHHCGKKWPAAIRRAATTKDWGQRRGNP